MKTIIQKIKYWFADRIDGRHYEPYQHITPPEIESWWIEEN
jgi:hypothetical protein